jgi:lipopolysaccharide transport system ATP-binding protein
MASIISARALTKSYHIRATGETSSYRTLREVISEPRQWLNAAAFASKPQKQFWALRDVSFDIDRGEVVGIIGKNGAGKSTLLKVLSRITAPTSGSALLRGRVGSLLEVGTGFHPELTGHENVFMNGAILGMSRSEIRRKYDQIIEFSGVKEFINTPIKRYSSGMQARLAFSVAAHLDPEILIVDEVLAVGDAEFQKKCIGKMKDVADEGRTVLFVSHNMNAIRNLCSRCILLKDGSVKSDSKNVDGVVSEYLNLAGAEPKATWRSIERNSEHGFIPLEFALVDKSGAVIQRPMAADEQASVRIHFELEEDIRSLAVGFALYTHNHELLYVSYSNDAASNSITFRRGLNTASAPLPENLLNDGMYKIQLIAGVHNVRPILSRDESQIAIQLQVNGNKFRSPTFQPGRPTILAPVLHWSSTFGESLRS